ncbi:MAG: GRRM system radical SAM/SPASM domain protein [Chroococcidiopsidaceae cyanobacterium CP_BM_RX_35]|nr:GRRM system radical SAM/SPASM domain protein [Chroococcidiopsidaceae cyanobacterium CP_BM_RX_35]
MISWHKNPVNSSSSNFETGPLKLVVIQPTSFCNLDCDYCYLPDRRLQHQFSLDLLEPIFKDIFSTNNLIDREFTIVWHSGEPLTVPISFYKLAFDKVNQLNDELNSSPFTILHSIQTNGTLINQAWCDFIKQNKVKIGVSLDGPAFIHDTHRKTRKGAGTHASTMRGIALLQKNDIAFSIIAVLTENSLDYPDEIFNFFLNHQIPYVCFNIEELEGVHKSSSLNKSGMEERYRFFMTRFYELVKGTGNLLKVREFEQTRELILRERDVLKGQCTPFTMINIAYNGDFSTFSPELLPMKSSTYGDFILGNILQNTFASVFESDKFKRINDDIQSGVSLCQQTCQYFSLCGGGAPANKYFENGSFRTAETLYCRYTKKILTDIILKDIEEALGIR